MSIKSEKVELLRKVDLFSQLREYELDIIADYSEFIPCKKGDAVFVQGSASDNLFVVDKGRIGIISLEGSDDAVIAQIVAEESFGELDFLGRTSRSASAFAEMDSMLLRFPSVGHKPEEIFQKHSFIFARLLYTLLGTISQRIWNVNQLLHEKTGWLFDLHKQLLCDKMTGLYNQVFLKEDFVTLLPEIGSCVALLMIKPDNFKEINDGFGHVAGDQVLNLMAIFLLSELGDRDIGVRFRGDEYAAILVDTDREKALAKAEEIRQTFLDMDLSGVSGCDMRINVSIGLVLYPEEADNSAALVADAHKKMFVARNNGGNRIVS